MRCLFEILTFQNKLTNPLKILDFNIFESYRMGTYKEVVETDFI